MPDHVKFLLRHVAIGLIIAIICVIAILLTDFARLATLMGSSDVGLLALVLLTFMLGLTFGSVQMGVAIMLLPYDKGGPDQRQPARVIEWLRPPSRKFQPMGAKIR